MDRDELVQAREDPLDPRVLHVQLPSHALGKHLRGGRGAYSVAEPMPTLLSFHIHVSSIFYVAMLLRNKPPRMYTRQTKPKQELGTCLLHDFQHTTVVLLCNDKLIDVFLFLHLFLGQLINHLKQKTSSSISQIPYRTNSTKYIYEIAIRISELYITLHCILHYMSNLHVTSFAKVGDLSSEPYP